MGKSDPFSKKVLSVREQLALARTLYPNFQSSVIGKTLRVEGSIRPTEWSADYLVRFEYEVEGPPRVTVLSPKLEPREPGGKLKHVYPGDHPCLYLPNSGEWTPDKPLVRSLIPWAAEWLFHYEVWIVTGVWCGGGVEPQDRRTIHRGPR